MGKNAPAEVVFKAGRWSDKYAIITIRNDERNVAKCKMVIGFFGRLEVEKEIISLGQYYIEIIQERWFDNGMLTNSIGFEEFKQLSNEEKRTSKDFVFAEITK